MKTRLHATPKTAPCSPPVPGGVLQRKCACGGTPGPTGECESCRKKKLQRRPGSLSAPSSIDDPSSSVLEVPSIVHEVLRAPGQSLDAETRAFMEPRLGHDFSRVRVHTNAEAAESTQAVNALAYAVGQNVVFGAGRYSPATHEGRRLLAHELTHVVQQETGIYLKGGVGEANDSYERHADEVARLVGEERSAVKLLATYGSAAQMAVGRDVIQFSSLAPITQSAPEVSAEKPESDFQYQDQNGVTYYVKLHGLPKHVWIALLSSEEISDSGARKAMNKFAESKDNPFPKSWLTKPWVYHRMYGGHAALKFDRWGDIDLRGTKIPLTCLNGTALQATVSAETLEANLAQEKLSFYVEDLLESYRASAPEGKIPGVAYSASGAGLDESTGKLSEFVVLLVKDPDKLTYTYMYWNDSFSAKDKKQPKTSVGQVAYYTLERPSGFENAWGEQDSNTFLSKMDNILKGKQISLEQGLRPMSYEAYRSAADKRKIIDGGQTKTVPISEAWGKRDPDKPGHVWAKMQPFFPPKLMTANFASKKSDIDSMVDVVENDVEFSKEKFLAGLKDVLMYLTYYPDVTITIEGHTSRKGGEIYNKTLSTDRANSVKNYMLYHAEEWSGKPLENSRIKTTGKGSADAAKEGKGIDNDDVADRKIVIVYEN